MGLLSWLSPLDTLGRLRSGSGPHHCFLMSPCHFSLPFWAPDLGCFSPCLCLCLCFYLHFSVSLFLGPSLSLPLTVFQILCLPFSMFSCLYVSLLLSLFPLLWSISTFLCLQFSLSLFFSLYLSVSYSLSASNLVYVRPTLLYTWAWLAASGSFGSNPHSPFHG